LFDDTRIHIKPLISQNRGINSHIPLYKCPNTIDVDTVAFWYLGPNLVSPSGERREIQLGDLGYLDDSGEFCPIFNIFRSYDEKGAHPPSQAYQHRRVNLRSVVGQVDIHTHTTYTSSNIEKLVQEAGPHPKE